MGLLKIREKRFARWPNTLKLLLNGDVPGVQAFPRRTQAKVTADRAAAREDPVKSERMAEMAATFSAADTNQDGVLSMEEFHDFMGKMKQNSEARGVPMAGRDDVPEDM